MPNTYRKIDLNAGLTTEGLRVSHSSAEALTFETLPAASNPFLQLDLTPLPLLRDTQIAWAQRALIALIAAAMLIWLYGRLQLPTSLSRIADGPSGPRRDRRIRRALVRCDVRGLLRLRGAHRKLRLEFD